MKEHKLFHVNIIEADTLVPYINDGDYIYTKFPSEIEAVVKYNDTVVVKVSGFVFKDTTNILIDTGE